MPEILNEVVLPDGSVRRLGNNSGEVILVSASPLPIPALSRAELLARASEDLETGFLPPVHDQDGIGQCNPEGTTGAVESQRMKQGLAHVELSAADLYDRINGGADNGSLLEDALREMAANGVGTKATCRTTLWSRGFVRAPAAERAKFRVLEAYLCPSFEACATAVLEEFDLVTGILWGNGDNPDRDGWLPGRVSGRPGGHAIHGYKLVKRGGVLGIAHQNSWGRAWGLTVAGNSGLFVIPESRYDRAIGGWWAVRSVVDEGGVVPLPS